MSVERMDSVLQIGWLLATKLRRPAAGGDA